MTDFGIAKIVTEQMNLTERTSILGTPDYMAPEQAAGRPASAAADIYSLGAILYELLTGHPPFHSSTLAETLRRVTEEDATPPMLMNREVNTELGTICLKCLEKEPLNRYASAKALAEDLENWLEHKPISARRKSAILRTRRWIQRNPAITALLGVLVLALCGALFAVHERVLLLDKLRNEHQRKLEKLWRQEVDLVEIPADIRVLLMGGSTRDAQTRLTFAIYVHDQTPWGRLEVYAPVLNELERSVSKRLKQPVQIDFVIYRSYELARKDVLNGKVDFARFGAASYVIAKKEDARVSILAGQKHRDFKGVIFTQSTNSIQRLEDLKGRSLTWGNTNSTIGCQLARFYLAEHNFQAKDFSNLATNFQANHARVTNAIAQGKFDAGAAKESYVKNNESFRILGKYPNVGMVWVARPDFPTNISKAIKCGLLLMKPKLLEGIEDDVIGFEEKTDRDYDELRRKMENDKSFYPQ